MHENPNPPWPMVARDAEFSQALTALTDDTGYQGVALIGGSGVGKSLLARALARNLESHGWTVRHAFGTRTGACIPLGAFCRSITVDTPREPAVMLATAYQTLAKTEHLLLVVDDAQQLDPLSALLVSQAVAEHIAHAIITLRSGEPASDAIEMLVKEQIVRTLYLGPFTREQTGELVRLVLGANTEALSDEFHRRSGGNPLFVRGLIRAAQTADDTAPTERPQSGPNRLLNDDELLNLLQIRLHTLSPAELNALEVLAVAELLDADTAHQLCDVGALSALESKGLIKPITDGAESLVQLCHPLLGEGALELAGTVRNRRLNGILAQAMQRRVEDARQRSQPPDLRTQIRLAHFIVRSDLEPDLDAIITAAENALVMSNLPCAEELGRFAFDRGGDVRAAIVLATALIWRGHSDQAEVVLRNAGLNSDVDFLNARCGCLRAANLCWGCGDIEEARRVLAHTGERVSSAAGKAHVTAVDLSLEYFSGRTQRPLEVGLALCRPDVSPFTYHWAALSTAYAFAAVGRADDVRRTVEAGIRTTATPAPGLDRFIVGAAQVLAFTAAGDHGEAEAAAKFFESLGRGIPESRPIIDAIFGFLDHSRGRLADACSEFRRSAATLPPYPALFRLLVLARSAQAESARANPTVATERLRRAEEVFGPHSAVFLPELELARAWVLAANGQVAAGRSCAARSGQSARRLHMPAVELGALHAAVRFGDPTQAARLAELATQLRTPMAEAIAAHGHGLADRDGDELDAAAQRFEDLEAMALAADAAAHAARQHAHRGHRGKELASAAHAQRLAELGDVRTPAVGIVATPLPLTGREREIAWMVAAGLTNRDIAQRLFLSVRTVEGHLYRIFAKLDIERRDELVRLIDAARPADTATLDR